MLIRTINFKQSCVSNNQYRGLLKIQILPRLLKIDPDIGGELDIKLQCTKMENGYYVIRGDIIGQAKLTCQRCLGLMDYTVKETFRWRIINGYTNGIEDKDYESVLVEEDKLNLHSALEDELLLVLPRIPKHTNPNCSSKLNEFKNSPSRINPFSSLGQLSRGD